jgi:penicillin-binding protein 2
MSSGRDDNLFTRRALTLSSLGGLFFAAVGVRMGQLQIFENSEFRLEAAENQFNLLVNPASRGPVYDRFGIPLAVNRRDFRVSIMREDVDDLPKTINALASILRIPSDKAAMVLADARVAPRFMPALVAENLSWEEYSRVNVYAASFPGVRAEMGEARNYPLAESFAHVIGYVAKANDKDVAADPQSRHPGIRVGKEGIERSQEQGLKGKHGATKLEVNAHGRVIHEVVDPRLAPTSGTPVVLTIDAEIQQLAYDQFMAPTGDTPTQSGAAVVLDLVTGDVIALVSAPGFDPNKFVDGIGRADFTAYNTDERQPLYHKAVRGTYPPGSTYKIVTGLAVLEAGLVKEEDTVFCGGAINIGGNLFHCASRRGHGRVNFHQAFRASCNVYFYEMGRRVGGEAIGKMASKLGIGQKYELGIPGVRTGYVATPEYKLSTFKQRWTLSDTINSCIGQGLVAVSPLQLAIMAARVGAKGKAIEPRLIHEGPGASPPKNFASLGFDPKNIEIMLKGLYGVANEAGGTGRGDIGIEGMTIGGKTGTAQVGRITAADRRAGVRNASLERKRREHALFVCYGPTENPRYACAVVVEHAGMGGGKAAAPRAREIMRATLLKDPASKPYFSAKQQIADATSTRPLAPLNATPKKGKA